MPAIPVEALIKGVFERPAKAAIRTGEKVSRTDVLNPFENLIPTVAELPTERGLPTLKEHATAKDIYPKAFAGVQTITDPGAREAAEAIITRQLGFGHNELTDITTRKAVNTLMGVQAVTKLGLSQIAQVTQFLTPAAQTGFRDSLKDVFRLADKDPLVHDRLLRTGSFLQQLIRDSHQLAIGDAPFAEKMLKMSGFTFMDTAARKYGALRAWSFASHQAEELADHAIRYAKAGEIERRYLMGRIRKIEEKLIGLDLDPAKIVANGGVLDESDFLRAGLKLSTDVNFWGDSLSLPVFWKSPWGRVLTQFKSFVFQQTKFLKDHVVKPAMDGDIGPLLRLTPVSLLGGEAINDIKSLIKQKPRDKKGIERLVQNMASMGYFGIFADAVMATEDPSRVSSAVLGPTASDAITGIYGVGQAAFHGNAAPLARQSLRTALPFVPVVGPIVTPAVVNKLLPTNQKKRKLRRRRDNG